MLGLVLLVWLLIQTDAVQNFLIPKVTARFSKEWKTEVTIKHVSFSLFDKMDLDKTLIRDRQHDTLLYAGALRVRITDWFFFKSKADLKYIGLEDAVIKQQRKDSVWNFQFLIDYFAAPQTTDTTKGIELNIQKIDFKNVTILKNDEWFGQKMFAKTGSMLLEADKIDFVNNIYQINSLELDKPYVSLKNFAGNKPKHPFLNTNKKDSGLYFNAAGIMAQIKECNITNGFFGIQKGNTESLKNVFDGTNIQVSKLKAKIENFNFTNDTIKANINLSGIERCGLIVRQLKTNYRLTPQIMEFANLDIRTNKSRLSNYYAMRFKDFNKDFADYVQQVIMDIHLRNSSVSSDDIAYFAPALNQWNQQFTGNIIFHGTVSNFKVNNLSLRNNAHSYIAGNLAMKGLPDINKTLITLTSATVQTNSREIAFLYPGITKISNPNLAQLGNTRFTGNFSGTYRDFVAKGNISSALGNMYADISMDFSKPQPSYKGKIQTQQFNIGKFLSANGLGNVGFTGDIEGYSFSLDKLNTKLNGSFTTLEYNGYTYSNLTFNGAVEKSKFNGELKADDPNFNFTSIIEIDLSGDKPSFNVLGDLEDMKLKNLNLSKENFELTGLFDLNFVGRNIDEFTGSAKILNASILHNKVRLNFDSLSVNSYYDSSNQKILSAQSNEFDVSIRGQYKILDLPNSFQSFLSHYYPAYIKPPKTIPLNQHFALVVTTRDFDRYAKILDSNLSGFSDVYVLGSINTIGDKMFSLDTRIPYLKYKNYSLEDARINGTGTYDTLNVSGNVGRIYLNDSFYFPNTELKITAANDHSVVNMSTSANRTLNSAELNADVFTLPDGVRINFQPSSFVLNEKKWNLEKKGELVIQKKFASAHNVKFTQGLQEIAIETEEEDGSNTSNLVARLKNVNMADFMPLILRKPQLEGIANGNIYLHDFYGKFNIDANIKASDFRLDKDSVGIVNVSGNYNSTNGKVQFNVISNNEKYDFTAQGAYNTKDSTHNPLNTTAHLNNTKINFINEFLGGLFSDITGLATGDVTLHGDINSPHLTGEVLLRDGALTVNFTKVRYTIDSALFNFKEDRIEFGQFTIHDASNNSGTVKGILYETGFKNMSFNLDMSSDKMLLFDTKPNDNEHFYGKVIGRATLSLKGPEENIHMVINGEVNDTSHIFIPTSSSKGSTEADFIVFKQYGDSIKKDEPKKPSSLTIDLDVSANNNAQIDVILDELTGDIIKATGNGRLQIHVPATGDLTMKGRYDIEGGKYDFNFQSLVKKPFELLPGTNSYIEWNGDPYNARINIDALYTAKNVSLSNLVSGTGLNLGGTVQAYKGDVYVIAELTGRLTQPDIQFRLDFPQGSPIKNDDNFNLFLSKLQSDDNEMLKQVTWLIVFGSFAPYGSIAANQQFATSTSINTISQKIASEVNKLVSNLLYRLTGDKSLQFDIGTQTYSSASLFNSGAGGTNNTLDRQSVNLKINQSLLNGKLLITFGSDFDFNLTSSAAAQTGNFQWLPDISAQIVLSKNGNLKAIVFNRSSLDVYGGAIGRRTRQGISISYSIDIDSDKMYGAKPKPVRSKKKVNEVGSR